MLVELVGWNFIAGVEAVRHYRDKFLVDLFRKCKLCISSRGSAICGFELGMTGYGAAS